MSIGTVYKRLALGVRSFHLTIQAMGKNAWKRRAAGEARVREKKKGCASTGSTIRTLLHGKINPKDWQVLSLGDVGFLLFFRVVSGDYGKPWSMTIPDTSCVVGIFSIIIFDLGRGGGWRPQPQPPHPYPPWKASGAAKWAQGHQS